MLEVLERLSSECCSRWYWKPERCPRRFGSFRGSQDQPNNERAIPCPAARRGNCWFGMTKSGTPLLKFQCLPSWSYSCTFNMIQGDCRVSSQRENAQIQICIPLQKRGRAGGTGAAYLSAGAHQTEWLGNQRFHLDQRFRIRKRRFAGRSASLLMNHGNQ
jgi:hypothetical protein